MQPELYSVKVKLFSGEAQVMVMFNDLAPVSVLYEKVSGMLCVLEHSFSLVYETRLIPQGVRSGVYEEVPQAIDFFRFHRGPSVINL